MKQRAASVSLHQRQEDGDGRWSNQNRRKIRHGRHKGGIEIILDNYPNFLEIMDGFEESLKYLILNDRRATRRRSMGILE